MGRGKSQLKNEDYLVLNAAKWWWWHQYQSHAKTGDFSRLGQIRVSKQSVHWMLLQAYGRSRGHPLGPQNAPLDEEQCYYRLTKLEGRGLLKKGYGDFHYTQATDPYIWQEIENGQKEQQDQVARDEQLVERAKEALDRVLPGHTLTLNVAYGGRTLGYPNVALTGPGHQIRMLIQWAEAHVKAMDEAVVEEDE